MHKGIHSASILATSITAGLIGKFGDSIGKDFSSYCSPSTSKLALAHFNGNQVNGVVTVDFKTGASGKTADITITGNESLSCSDKHALGKFALLKSVNFGCSSVTLKGITSCGDLFGKEFGTIEKNGDILSFNDLPQADLSTSTTYVSSGIGCALTALASITAGNIAQAMTFGMGFGISPFSPAYSTSTRTN